MMMQKMQRRCQVGIQPIDLQTIYAQMEKVGKQQGAEQASAILNREKQEEANKSDAEKILNSVKNSESINNDRITINDNTNPKNNSGYKRSYKNKNNQNSENTEDENYIKDPKLGSRVDISG